MGLAAELLHVKQTGLFELFVASAERHHLPLAFVLAVASRESDMENVIGDHGYAIGIMQVDIRFHEIAKQAKATGSWKTNPGELIDYGIALLAGDFDWAKSHFPNFGGNEDAGWLKIAANAYNAGRGGAERGALKGNSDLFTTGHNYGSDVLARMASIKHLL